MRHKCDLDVPNANLSIYQKSVNYAGIELYNALPCNIKILNHDIKVLKST
jgi:hypothetical protein